MGNAFWFSWEPRVIIFLQSRVTPLSQKIFESITFFGDEYAMILIIGFLYWGYKKELGRKIGLYATTALITSVALGNIVMRRRPYFDHNEIRCLKPRTSKGDPYDIAIQGFSFPSGHATNSVSTYAALGCNVKKKALKIVLFLIPVIIGISRIVLGVHYPTDVLAGWIISALVILVISHIKNQYIVYFIMALIGIAGCFFSKSTDYFSTLGITFGFIAGFIFEEKRVHFKNTEKVYGMILRTIGGLILFVLVDKILEIPFSKEFLSSASGLSFMVRTIRYTIASFTVIGIYPMLFGYVDKKRQRQGNKEQVYRYVMYYSLTTAYQDYSISNRLFHWQSQSTLRRVLPLDNVLFQVEEKQGKFFCSFVN